MSRLWSNSPTLTDGYPYRPGHVAHSPTSRAAAQSIGGKALGDLHRRVWRHLRAVGGSTDEEGMEALGMHPSTYRPRRVELMEQGWVRDSGRRRATRSGRMAIVWEVVR
jgi:hypothetical protein